MPRSCARPRARGNKAPGGEVARTTPWCPTPERPARWSTESWRTAERGARPRGRHGGDRATAHPPRRPADPAATGATAGGGTRAAGGPAGQARRSHRIRGGRQQDPPVDRNRLLVFNPDWRVGLCMEIVPKGLRILMDLVRQDVGLAFGFLQDQDSILKERPRAIYFSLDSDSIRMT